MFISLIEALAFGTSPCQFTFCVERTRANVDYTSSANTAFQPSASSVVNPQRVCLLLPYQCFDTVGSAAGRASGL